MKKLYLNEYKEFIFDLLFFFDYDLNEKNKLKIKDTIDIYFLEKIFNTLLNINTDEFTNDDLNSCIEKTF